MNANRIALAGVREEERVGQRTLLDVLNAEQELLNSEVNLATDRRNLVVASYTVLSTIGRLNAQELGVAALVYDAEAALPRGAPQVVRHHHHPRRRPPRGAAPARAATPEIPAQEIARGRAIQPGVRISPISSGRMAKIRVTVSVAMSGDPIPCLPPETLVSTPRGARSSAVEHLTFNQRVVGSIPTGLTIDSDGFVALPPRPDFGSYLY